MPGGGTAFGDALLREVQSLEHHLVSGVELEHLEHDRGAGFGIPGFFAAAHAFEEDRAVVEENLEGDPFTGRNGFAVR